MFSVTVPIMYTVSDIVDSIDIIFIIFVNIFIYITNTQVKSKQKILDKCTTHQNINSAVFDVGIQFAISHFCLISKLISLNNYPRIMHEWCNTPISRNIHITAHIIAHYPTTCTYEPSVNLFNVWKQPVKVFLGSTDHVFQASWINW